MYKKVYVEITNVCNLKCSFCLGNTRECKFMSISEFETILKKLEGYTKYLYFHVLGEPLMHPKINEFIDMASKKCYVNITTNGILLDKIKNNKHVRQINVSLHSFTGNKDELKEYLDNVMESINVLKKSTYISLRIWTNTLEKNDIVAYLESIYNKKILESMKLEENVFIDFESEFIWPRLDNKFLSDKGKCYGVTKHIGILVDGTVVPCCLDGLGVINLGNIFDESLEKIIESDRYQNMYKGFKCGEKREELCKKCGFLK